MSNTQNSKEAIRYSAIKTYGSKGCLHVTKFFWKWRQYITFTFPLLFCFLYFMRKTIKTCVTLFELLEQKCKDIVHEFLKS